MVKKLKKQYETPNEGWSEERINKEDELIKEFGLKNKKEVYKAESFLRSLRREARNLVAKENENQRQALIRRANELGLVKDDSKLEDILTLNTKDILNRRLQTAINRRGYSDTVREARQMVVHGHVYIDGNRVNIPSYLLTQEEEKKIEVRMPEHKDEDTEIEEEPSETENHEDAESEEEKTDD